MEHCLIQRILKNAEAFPERPAVVGQGMDDAFSYRELVAVSRRMAAGLFKAGVGRGDFVTIELPRKKEYIAAMLAAWMVGAAFAPLSPVYPAERLAYIRRDCGAKAVIDEAFLRGLAEEAEALDAVWEGEEPALLIYTSGSTGRPKGVLLSMAAMANAADRLASYGDLPEGCRTAIGAPFPFVAAVQFVFAALSSGWTAFVTPLEVMRDPVLLAEYIEANKIQLTFISPKILKLFKPKGDSLLLVHTGSERVSNIFSDRFRIAVGYGQSESAGAALLFDLDKKYDNTPIGKPVGNARAYVLDENGNEAVEGELCLAGIFADGYLHLPEETEKTFTDNPFRERDGFAKLLHTGDLVKMGEDGNIIFRNRRDWMVKINGQRVEPGEIEAVLKNIDGIQDAAVKDFTNAYGQVYLVAYYVAKAPVTAKVLREKVAEKLPSYMIPAFFVGMEALPVNQNGKLDRAALKAPEASEFKNAYAAPENEGQKLLCEAFAKVLDVEDVGADDDFFALGGDSIRCAAVLSACKGLPLSIADILAGRTPRAIERNLRKRGAAGDAAGTTAKKAEKLTVYPLSPMERGMYLEQLMNRESTSYNLNIAVTITGAKIEAVERALKETFAAHEAFHSTYGEKDGMPVRRVVEELPEIVQKSAATREEVLRIVEGPAVPFELSAGIPIRPTLYAVADGSVVLHLAIHHIAFDGGSAKPFAEELFARLRGEEVSLPETELSGLWDAVTEEKRERGLAYYKEMFADGVPVNEMPVKGPRPQRLPLTDQENVLEIGAESLKEIKNAARRYGITEFELIFSAISMVLGKYTGSEDVVLGIPTNTRPDGAEQVIGMFVNTAPVRVRPARGLDISGYLTAVSEAVRSATRGSSLPFEDVVAEFAKARDASRSPIFDVSVNYLWEPAVYAADGLTLSMYVPLQRMGRDIGFTMRRQADRLLFMTQYSSALFEEDVIRNMIAQIWETIGLLEKGSVRTVREALALPKAQEERLAAFSRTAEAEVPVTLLHQLFEKAAAKNAERTALIAKDGTLTYRELNESANIVAHNLIARGIAVGDSVALLLPRESSFFRCLFGVNKAGAAFIPCDPKYPVERTRTILEDSGASLLITTADRLGEYPEGKAVDVAELLSGDKAENPNLPMSGDELAYMIYTSGSTGKPKGVMLRHAGICNYLQPHPANVHMAFVREFVETYLSVTTVSFDMSFKEHTAALCNGKTLLFASDEAGNDPQELARLMQAHGVDCLNATPSRLQQYLFSGAFCEALKNCKCVMSGGEGYPLSLRDQIREIAPNVRIFNTYGPTEITVSCNGVDLTNAPCVTVGRPLLNYHECIVDKFGDLAPYGVAGELYVGGVGVAKGYRNLPEKTAEAFVEYKGERMYRTGDLAKFDGDGNVMILGRLDSQVKIRGLRIELGEVESVIREFPGVRDVTVQAFTPPAGGKALAAYIVSDSPVDEKALAAFIAKTKPSYMVPEAVVQLDRIPLNQNQKVDRRALPTPEVRKAAPANAAAPRPLTRFEEEIAAVVKKAVGDVAIAPTEDLTSLGLTSVGAIGLATMLAERFQTEIPVNELLGGLSLVDLENRIFEEWMNRGFMPADEAKKAGPAVPETEKRDAYPLSFVQQAVYYDLMKRENAGTIYNIPHCLAFAEIDAARLANAVKAAVRAHSYLNTHFEIRDGAIVQVRDDAREVDVPVLQMEELSFAAYKEAFVRPFDTGVGPLYRFAVVVVDDGKTYLFMDIHHLVFDGFSRGVFLRDIGRAYRGEELLPEAYSYFDYAKEEADRQGTAAYKEDEAYFEELMQRFEVPSEVPADKSGMEENGKQADSVRLVPKELADSLSRKLGITPASLFLAASFYTVSRFAGTREVYISTIDTGRNLPKTHKAVGMFVHTLPLAMSFEKDQTVRELAAASEKALRGSVLHEGYPFAELAAKYGYTNQIMYECQIGMLSGEGNLGGVPFEDVPLGLEKPKFKISLSIVELDGSYGIYVRYNDAIYQKETMDALAEALGICIEHMAKDPEQSVRKLSLLGKEEAEVIASFGKAETAELPETVFHRVFEARVRENPDATALIACDKTLTFAELNSEANRVATSLMEMGVGKGGSCVLLLPRRSFYFAAMFGVLKAGAAFIPCDPEYPPERIRHIVHDADASCIITTEEHLPDYAGETVVDIQQLLLGEDRGNPDVPLTGEDMAYMIYTSGSTGRPKGVMMKHVCVVNCVYPHPVNEHYYVIKNEAKAVLGVTTVSFDMSFQETAGSLLNGKTLVFASEEELNDPRALTALFEQTGADVFDATPSRYLQYMEYEPFKKALGRCRLVMVGGEGFPQTLLEKLQAVLSPDAHIENAYGPTETTMACNGADLIKAPRVVAGPPLLNYESYIVDLDGNPVPRRVIGELLIGGIGVGIGYRNLPEMTEKRFIMYEGRRVYRSGDYARWDMDGNVEVLGRMDNQVKLRGQRIELGEIEGLMEAQPDIRRAVVAIRKIHGQDNLCAWFTADREIDVYELREELKKKLTAYMVPVAFAQLEKMPQTPNGKTDMKALPTPKAVELGEFVAPANAVEQFFCDLFKDILGMEKVGATDDFFSFGGTSLTATTVMIKATEAGYKLTYGDVFKYKTPRELASRFVRGEEKKEETTSVTAKTFDNYDYTAINALLAKNTIASFNGGEPRPIGNILLTGATGYMGAHLLAEYLRTETGTAYCLVRKGRYGTAIERLRYLLFYYFDQEFANVGGRVVAFDGDVTDYACFAALKDLPIDTVFNCAANVKHFSSGTDIEDINVGGAKNCVRFAEETGTRLIHFSTTSVGGAMLVSDPSQLRKLDEQSLYFGQLVENQYTSSKLLSERIVLEGVAERGVDAKVIRVGALSARASDGEFQINVLSNSAMGRLRSHVLLKCFPYTFMNLPFRMGPIDTSAKSFLHLARTPRECCLFHAINNHTVPYIDIIRVMREAGMEIAIVEEAIFLRALREAEADPEKAAILSSILAYTGRLKEAAVLVQETCEYTNQILARCGFYWDETDMAYIRRFIEGLKGLGFFDTDNLYR